MHIAVRGRLSLPAAFLLALLVLAVLPALALAADSPSPAASDAPVIYRVGLQSEVDNMNPFSTYNTIPWECFRVGYNFLTWYDADYKPVPDLATEVPSLENGGITEDGKVWTFHIRPNVKWSDGAAAHRAGRRLHVQPHPAPGARDVHRLLPQRDQGRGARRPDRGHHVQEAQRRHHRAVRADPPGAHLEQGPRQQGRVAGRTCPWSPAGRST